MNKQTKDITAASPELLAGAYPASYTAPSHRKERLKHPHPAWWPLSNPKRLILGHRVSDAIQSVAEELAYNIDNNLVINIKSIVANIEKVQNWRLALDALSQEYTDVLDFAYNGPAFVGEGNGIFITKIDANATTTLGPTTANLNFFSGLLGLLIDLENVLNQVHAYRVNQDYGIRLGFITTAPAKPNLATAVFEFAAFTLLDGQPAVRWDTLHHYVDGAVIEYRELGDIEAHWHPAGTVINNPGVLAIPRHALSRDVELRGRYYKKNQQHGDWSQPYRVTIPGA